MCIWSLRQTNSGCIRCVYGHCGRPTVVVSDVYMVIAADQQWLYQMCIWSLRQTNSGCIRCVYGHCGRPTVAVLKRCQLSKHMLWRLWGPLTWLLCRATSYRCDYSDGPHTLTMAALSWQCTPAPLSHTLTMAALSWQCTPAPLPHILTMAALSWWCGGVC